MYHLIIIIDVSLKDTLIPEIKSFLTVAGINPIAENVFDRKVQPFQKYKLDTATYFCAKVECDAVILKNTCTNMRNNLTGILVLRHFKLVTEIEKNIPNEVIDL